MPPPQPWSLPVTLDERIGDGFYFCRAVKAIEYLFANPKLLMEEASKPFEVPSSIHEKKK